MKNIFLKVIEETVCDILAKYKAGFKNNIWVSEGKFPNLIKEWKNDQKIIWKFIFFIGQWKIMNLLDKWFWLVTCYKDNIGSSKIIEKNCGLLKDIVIDNSGDEQNEKLLCRYEIEVDKSL